MSIRKIVDKYEVSYASLFRHNMSYKVRSARSEYIRYLYNDLGLTKNQTARVVNCSLETINRALQTKRSVT